MIKKLLKAMVAAALAGILLVSGIGCGGKENRVTDVTERTRRRAVQMAEKVLDKYIEPEYYNSPYEDEWQVYLYDRYNPYTDSQSGTASVWHYTAVMSMTNRMAEIGHTDKIKTKFESYNKNIISELAWYRGTGSIVSYNAIGEWTAYGVNRARRRNNASIQNINSVYDDQMWLVREFVSAYNRTGNDEYLKEAENLTAYCLDGWDSSIDPTTGSEYGGITWGPGYRTKHTCSNAPIVAPLVELSQLYKDSTEKIGNVSKSDYYKNWAIKIYEFTYAKLKNANDLYADLIGSSYVINEATGLKETYEQGGVDSTEYTYNTGAMISGGAKLYELTGDVKYLQQAQNSANAAYDKWGAKDAEKGLSSYPFTSTQWFNLILLIGFADLAEVDATAEVYVDSFRESLDYAYDNYYFDGILPRDLIGGWLYGSDFDSRKDVMDAAAYAEMYAVIYQYYLTKTAA